VLDLADLPHPPPHPRHVLTVVPVGNGRCGLRSRTGGRSARQPARGSWRAPDHTVRGTAHLRDSPETTRVRASTPGSTAKAPPGSRPPSRPGAGLCRHLALPGLHAAAGGFLLPAGVLGAAVPRRDGGTTPGTWAVGQASRTLTSRGRRYPGHGRACGRGCPCHSDCGRAVWVKAWCRDVDTAETNARCPCVRAGAPLFLITALHSRALSSRAFSSRALSPRTRSWHGRVRRRRLFGRNRCRR
jgi:hypothetical protein